MQENGRGREKGVVQGGHSRDHRPVCCADYPLLAQLLSVVLGCSAQ